MHEGEMLGQMAERLLPNYLTQFDWGDVWLRQLSAANGAALEWAMLAALVARAAAHGWTCSFPILAHTNGRELFRLRNEIPRHHGAQPGHAASGSEIDLASRFLQAFIPKVLLVKDGRSYSVFREGCPYHAVMSTAHYDERPDIAVLEGQPTAGFPRLVAGGTSVEFSFDLAGGGVIAGKLRLINSPRIPLQWRQPEKGIAVPFAGIVECSLNKPVEVARAQLNGYATLFGTESGPPPMVLVTGNNLSELDWPNAIVRLSTQDIDVLENDCCAAADLALSAFGIL